MKPKDPQKEAKIKDITLDIVYEKGLSGVKMADIAKKAKLSPSNLYIYFANKQDLLTSVFFDTISRLSQDAEQFLLGEDASFKSRLFRLFELMLKKKMAKTREFAFGRQFLRSPYFKDKHHSQMDQHTKGIWAIFHSGKQEQTLKEEIEFELFMAVLDGISDKLAEFHQNGRLKIDSTTVEKSFTLVWDALRK